MTSSLDQLAHVTGRRSGRVWLLRCSATTVSLLLVVLALVLSELVARACFPHVNYQDTEAALLGQLPGLGYVWRPVSEGVCFGERVRIDAAGCRDLEFETPATDRWLVLGDSVAFGVGVPAVETFVGRLQRALPQVRFLNTSVVGMNLDGQLAIARTMLARDSHIRRVTLFYCLNDLEGVSAGSPEPVVIDKAVVQEVSQNETTLSERLRGVLRSHSKLYLLLKGTLADRSQTYFRCDESYYRLGATSRLDGLNRLAAIADLATQRGVAFDVVILPYEYQLRVAGDSDEVWEPQRRVAEYLAARGISHVDARNWFADASHDSRHWYLFGDPMHLSAVGHRAVAEHWLEAIETDLAHPYVTARPVVDGAGELR